jgi:pyrroline-5-carboxylate reductase
MSGKGLHEKRIGIIGVGAMGSALARGLAASGVPADHILVSDPHHDRLRGLADELGFAECSSNIELATKSDVVLLAVKPYMVKSVMDEIAPSLEKTDLLISIAAGVRIVSIRESLKWAMPVVRAMPNNAARVLQSACAICSSPGVDPELFDLAKAIFACCGTAVEVEEEWMDAVTALSGSGPAYVYLMIEALVDGGVKAGLPRHIAHALTAQTVLGAAKMVQETNLHPAELKDLVATPGGTTITALALLEQQGVRAALIEAVGAAARRSKELGETK